MMLLRPESSPANAAPVWIDLLSPTPEERARAEGLAGLSIPTRAALSEIETSSRVAMRDGVLTLSTPSSAPRIDGQPAGPIGFVLSRQVLVTVRYSPGPAFDAVAASFEDPTGAPTGPLGVFVALVEGIVDHIADGLEGLAEEIAGVSAAAFHTEESRGRAALRSNDRLLGQLRGIGRVGDRLSAVRETLLGLARMTVFVSHHTESLSDDPDVSNRLNSQAQDIASLSDYEASLSNKVQFLLDAVVGLISIAQNEIFKVLTIVSIVGIPPTLVAGIYGMNFAGMPEYHWRYGYPFGLAMIALSAIIPLVWFKIRGWF